MTNKHQVFPIYDWTNNDVWLYLLREKWIFRRYTCLWQSGTKKGQLRVSQFFSIDTAKSLVKMNEYYPDLMERIIRREPNAYLAALYWDSEMFHRTTKKRRELEGEDKKDYRALLKNVEAQEVFKKSGVKVWECRNCGHIVVGPAAPEICPVCAHPQAYFEVHAENY